MQDSTPLYERLQFLAITSSNIDEFFCKRVGGLMRQAAAGTKNLKASAIHKRPPERQLDLIARVRSCSVCFVLLHMLLRVALKRFHDALTSGPLVNADAMLHISSLFA